MNFPVSAQAQTILKHVHSLSVNIGPRGSTTPGEKRGAEYCCEQMQQVGLQPVMETFQSARSIFQPHLLGSALMLISFLLYPLGGRVTAVIAALLALVTLASELLELGFANNLLRWLVPKGQSQNVVAVQPPSREHRQDLILIGHIDTQRTPLIFRSPRWVNAYKTFTTVAFVLFASQVIFFFLGAIFQWSWIWYAAIPSALGALLLAAICIEADSTPFTAGANDNASAVGMVLALAEEFSARPLVHTRVWFLCSGCEEVQHYGAIDFFERHRAEMHNPRGLVFEMLGCAGPAWCTKEGIIVPFHADPGLLKQVECLAAEHPEWGAYPVSINGGNSEMADCLRYKVPAITLFGLEPNGDGPYWHQKGDTYDKMKPELLEKVYQLTRAMIGTLDQ